MGVIGSLLPKPSPEQIAARQAEEAKGAAAQAVTARASATKVTARELFQAYQANEAAAQERYGHGPLEVSGVVDGVDLDFSDEPIVKLRTDNQFMSAQAQLIEAAQPHASTLSQGNRVTLLCDSVGEVIGTPILKDCQFVE